MSESPSRWSTATAACRTRLNAWRTKLKKLSLRLLILLVPILIVVGFVVWDNVCFGGYYFPWAYTMDLPLEAGDTRFTASRVEGDDLIISCPRQTWFGKAEVSRRIPGFREAAKLDDFVPGQSGTVSITACGNEWNQWYEVVIEGDDPTDKIPRRQ